MHKATGTIKWFNATKGFGFIVPDNSGPDVFVHISALQRSQIDGAQEGDRFAYDIEMNRKTGKPCACSLQRVD